MIVLEGSHDRSTVTRSFTTSRSYTRYAILPFAVASVSFGISSFRLSITRCDRSSLTKMSRGFCLRAAYKMVSRSLYNSILTTTVFGRHKEFDALVLWARSMRIAFAWSFGSFTAAANVFLATASVSAQRSAATSATPSIRKLFLRV